MVESALLNNTNCCYEVVLSPGRFILGAPPIDFPAYQCALSLTGLSLI